jgi:hypothetical protein
MVHLVMALLLLEAPIPLRPIAGKPSYRVTLRPDRRDYQVTSPPGPGDYAVILEGVNPSGKCKLVFDRPLRPGTYALEIRPSRATIDQTFVVSVPLGPGPATFVVTAAGKARYDFAFHYESGAHKEYRFTFTAPVSNRRFELAP